jgi:hypothetical protein
MQLWNTFHAPEDIEPALDDSLSKLDTEYLDLYLIHWWASPSFYLHPVLSFSSDFHSWRSLFGSTTYAFLSIGRLHSKAILTTKTSPKTHTPPGKNLRNWLRKARYGISESASVYISLIYCRVPHNMPVSSFNIRRLVLLTTQFLIVDPATPQDPESHRQPPQNTTGS